jgi:hypothetical protein
MVVLKMPMKNNRIKFLDQSFSFFSMIAISPCRFGESYPQTAFYRRRAAQKNPVRRAAGRRDILWNASYAAGAVGITIFLL